MTDIALAWDNARFGADLVLQGSQIGTDDGMRTAILISLFTDARARPGDVLPDPDGERRGWWGDGFALTEGDETGSRLWLLSREKRLPSVLARARDLARDALRWLTEDGVARDVNVTAEALNGDWLAIGVEIERPTGPGRERYDFVWNASTGEVKNAV